MEKEELMEKTVWQQKHGSVIFWTVSAGIMIFLRTDIDSFQKAKEISLMMPSNRSLCPFLLMEAFGCLYSVKRSILARTKASLAGIAQLCLDEAFQLSGTARSPDIRKV